MSNARDNHRATGELAALAQAQPRAVSHGCIDSPHDAPEPCVSCRWCHRARTPAAAVLNPTTATVVSPE